MKKRKGLVIFLSFFLLGTIICILTFEKKNKPKLSSEVPSTSIQNMFLPINGTYSLQVGEVTPLNFVYIYSKDNKDLFDKIESIKLNNSNSIDIESFVVNGDVQIGNYRVKNLGINIIGISEGKTNISGITIKTGSATKDYKIGALGIDVMKETSEMPLEEGNMYPVLREEKSNYIYRLKNSSANNIKVNKFDAELNGEQIINIEPFVISPNVEKEEEVPLKIDLQKSAYAVTVMRPSIHYSVGKEQRVLIPPPTWYGLMEITKEQIEKTIKYNN